MIESNLHGYPVRLRRGSSLLSVSIKRLKSANYYSGPPHNTLSSMLIARWWQGAERRIWGTRYHLWNPYIRMLISGMGEIMFELMKYMLVATALLLSLTGMAQAQDTGSEKRQSKPGENRHCLPIQDIDHIEVVDNQTILFHTRGKKIWKNSLPHHCAGLKFEGGIGYRTSIDQLCDLDIITVLRVGTTCQLGSFEKYEPEEATEKSPE
jgi:hypothetical protein